MVGVLLHAQIRLLQLSPFLRPLRQSTFTVENSEGCSHEVKTNIN